MSKKYVPLDRNAGRELDDEWKKAGQPHIDGVGSHAGIPGLLTVTLEGGTKIKLNLRKTESGEFLLGFEV